MIERIQNDICDRYNLFFYRWNRNRSVTSTATNSNKNTTKSHEDEEHLFGGTSSLINDVLLTNVLLFYSIKFQL